MNTSDVITAYIAARRAQGVQIRSGARALRQFARETGDRPLHEVTPPVVITFLRGHGALSASWTTKFRLLAGLYRFALTRGYVAASPLPEMKPKLPPPQTPYVYSRDELQRLLDSTAVVSSPLSCLQAMTYRTLLLMLYGAGLRISEAIDLTVADVDIAERLLTVRNTKFYKTRLVPIGPQLASALAAYYEKRSTLPMLTDRDSAFLCTRTGCCLAYPEVITCFQRIRSAAGIVCPPGEPRPPRLHDLRHTTAVHLLRAGVDINTIRAWLGHVSLDTTHVYAEVDLDMKAKALACVDITDLPAGARTKSERASATIMNFMRQL